MIKDTVDSKLASEPVHPNDKKSSIEPTAAAQGLLSTTVFERMVTSVPSSGFGMERIIAASAILRQVNLWRANTPSMAVDERFRI